jgi:hypothetical protein
VGGCGPADTITMYSMTLLRNEVDERDRRYAAKVQEAIEEKQAALQMQRQPDLAAHLRRDLESLQRQVGRRHGVTTPRPPN